MTKKITSKMKAIACLFAFFILITQSSKAQCTIVNQTPNVNPSTICGTGTATISIPGSQLGVTYAVATGTTIVSGPTAGTGQPMTFTVGPISATTTFIVGAANGTCTVSMTPAVTVTVNPLPVVTITGSTITCSGQPDLLTAGGASTYTWSANAGGATTATVAPTPTANTNYTVTGTDANGCKNTAVQTVSVSPNPTVNIASSGFGGICPGQTTTLTASGGVTYTWSANAGGVNTATVALSPSVTTVYTVTGSNAAGCMAVRTRTVTVNPPVTITVSGNSFLCQGQSAVLNASGGTTYTWSTTQTTATISVSPTVTTSYSVVGTGGFGTCPGSAVKTVTVSTTPPPTVTISGSTVTCSGQPDLLTANGASTYTWSANAGGATTATVAPTPTVGTNYTVTGTDVNGCSGSGTFSVTVAPNPTVNIAGTNTICAGSSTTFTASGATTYTWSANAGSATTSTVALTPSVTTVYTVTGTNAAGCTSIRTRTVTVNAAPGLTVTPQTICTGSTATLTASGALNYTWSPGLSSTNGATVTGSPTVTTTYTVSGTNGSGCVGTTTASINVVTNLTVTATPSSSVVCTGSSLTLTGIGASSYTWNSGGGTISGGTGTTVTVTPVGPSTSYTVTGASGTCTATPYIFSVNVNALPTVSALASPNDTICNGSSVTLNGNGANTYSWTGGVTDGTAFTPTVTATYTVTGTDLNGCTAKVTQTVTVRPLPNVNYTTGGATGGICPGTTATLTASGATTYTWVNSGSNAALITVTPTVTTSYTLTGSDAFGCIGTRIRTIPILPTPSVTVSGPSAICVGQTATLTAASSGTVTVTSYVWDDGTNGVTDIVTPTVTTTYTVFASGTQCTDTVRTTVTVGTPPSLTVTATSYTICQGTRDTLTVSGASSYTWNPTGSNLSTISGVLNATATFTVTGDNGGCKDSATVTITVKPGPTITANASSLAVCLGNSLTLTGSGTSLTYTWSGGASDGVPFVPSATQSYTVIGTAANGCTKQAFVTVIVNGLPTISTTATPNDTVCINGSVTLNGNGGVSYVWTGGVTDGVAFNPSSTATYTVTGTDGNGCSDTSSIQIVLDPGCTTGMNTITNAMVKVYPNPSNGNLFVSMTDFENANVEVYNSLGEKVYTKVVSTTKENVNLEKLSTGVYFIQVKQNGTPVYKGNIVMSK